MAQVVVRRVLPGLGAVLVGYGTLAALEESNDRYGSLWLLVCLVPPLVAAAALLTPTHRTSTATGGMVLAIVALAGQTDTAVVSTLVLGLAVLATAATPERRIWTVGAVGLGAAAVGAALALSWGFLLANTACLTAAALLALLLRSREHSLDLERTALELRSEAQRLQERAALARELHDAVGHHVTAMVVQAEAGRLADAEAALANIGEAGRLALDELDHLVVHLRAPDSRTVHGAPVRLLDVEELLAAPLRASGVDVTVAMTEGIQNVLDDRTLRTVYRIVQESLTNVARHAGATRAWVDLRLDDTVVTVRISDDGRGLPRTRGRGSGLLGVEERVAEHAGRLVLGERPGGGLLLEASLPLGRFGVLLDDDRAPGAP